MRRGAAWLGVLIALVGLGMIGLAFYLAYQMFLVPPSQAMKIVPGEPMDFGMTVNSLIQVIVKVVMLVLMAGFGSLFANRGIKLYEADRKSRFAKGHKEADKKPSPAAPNQEK
ncbi:MAG: hypothetical protein ABUL72_07315 [Armatimonadota bacterium]